MRLRRSNSILVLLTTMLLFAFISVAMAQNKGAAKKKLKTTVKPLSKTKALKIFGKSSADGAEKSARQTVCGSNTHVYGKWKYFEKCVTNASTGEEVCEDCRKWEAICEDKSGTNYEATSAAECLPQVVDQGNPKDPAKTATPR